MLADPPTADEVARQRGFPNLRLLFKLALLATRSERGSVLVCTEQGFVIQQARKIPRRLVARAYLPRQEDVTSWVAREHRPLLVASETDLPVGLRLRRHGYRGSSFASVPILDGRRLLGVLNIADRLDGAPFDQRALQTLLLIARQATELVRLHQHLAVLQRLVRVDPTTGLPDRQALDETLRTEVARARRYDVPLSVVLIAFDERDGPRPLVTLPRGRALQAVAARCRQNLRSSDSIYAFDDDQLLVLLPHTDARRALAPAARLQRVLRSAPAWETAPAARMGICSAPALAESAELLLARATQALRSARSTGESVAIWREDTCPPAQVGDGSGG